MSDKKGKKRNSPAAAKPAGSPVGTRHGIGEHIAIASALYFREKVPARFLDAGGKLHSGWWKSDHGKLPTREPGIYIGPAGSANQKLVAMLLELLVTTRLGWRSHPAQPEWTDPRVWLTAWYVVMRNVAHDGYELGSTIYGGAHCLVAMFCAALGIPGAAEHLQRAISFYSIHLTPEKRLIMAGGRSKRTEDVGLELFSRYMLGEDKPTRRWVGAKGKAKVVHGGMEIEAARRLSARQWVDTSPGALAAALATIKSAGGTLVHRRHERGFAAYYETGPRCAGWPLNAVVAPDSGEPTFVRQPLTGGKAEGRPLAPAQAGAANALVVTAGDWRQRVDLLPLGALVCETRFERAA